MTLFTKFWASVFVVCVAAVYLGYQYDSAPQQYRSARATAVVVPRSCASSRRIALTLDGDVVAESFQFHMNWLALLQTSFTLHVAVDPAADEAKKAMYRQIVSSNNSLNVLGLYWKAGDPRLLTQDALVNSLKTQSEWLHNITDKWVKFVRMPVNQTNSTVETIVRDLGYIQTWGNPDEASLGCTSAPDASLASINVAKAANEISYLTLLGKYNRSDVTAPSFIGRHALDCRNSVSYFSAVKDAAPAYNYTIVSLNDCLQIQGSYNSGPPELKQSPRPEETISSPTKTPTIKPISAATATLGPNLLTFGIATLLTIALLIVQF